MFYLNDMCCLCLNNKLDLRKMCEVNYGNFSYYNKIIICIPQMIFTELNNEKCVCKTCCDFVDDIFRFRDMCLRNGYILKNYISKLRSVSNQHGDISVNLNDFQNYINTNETDDHKDEKTIDNETDIKNVSHPKTTTQPRIGCRTKDETRLKIKSTNHSRNKSSHSRNKSGNHSRNKSGNHSRNKTRNHLKRTSRNQSFTEEQFCKFEELSTDLKKDDENPSTSLPENPKREVVAENQTINNETENPVATEEINTENQVTADNQTSDLIKTEDAVKMEDQVKMERRIKTEDQIKIENPIEVPLDTEVKNEDDRNESKDLNDEENQTETTEPPPGSSPIVDGAKKIYKCQHCSKVCSTSYNFVKHFKTHKKKMPFKCSVCKKCFIFSKDLVKHLKNHIKEETTVNK